MATARPPKPRPTLTPEQKRAFDARLKKDGTALGLTLLDTFGKFLDRNHDNIISQVFHQPIIKASVVTVVQKVREMNEQAAADEAAAESEIHVKDANGNPL